MHLLPAGIHALISYYAIRFKMNKKAETALYFKFHSNLVYIKFLL
ncbi:hypothetical protein CHCC20327_3365 [Bacillus licheniformis]|nr:hypothetical protein CHCC20487_1732 [Bacillus licheniformis]TWK88358.1 hypothetical protein CHCC20327_3365 [Bacillus licheniformis]